ncbi:glycoside hydrolase family 3 protein, partial [Sphingomonas sp.]|uniref:glycoside hydrolase family 3 protein n=1 Tax=Sphingomonas sp. TaxID=28214 RepID=UPI0035C81C8F
MTKPWHKGLSLSLLLSTVPCLAQEAPVRAEKEEASADPDARAAKTLAAMTTDEKIDLLHGPMPSFVPPAKRPADMILGAGYIAGVKRLGIPPLNESDASLGVANLGNKRAGDVATALPSGLAIASGWWPEQAERAGAMIGGEARAKGFNVLLAGGVNLTRETRNGRNFEYLGEDPLLAGTLAGYGIRGVQSARIISTIKHFALNAQETGRNSVDAVLEEAALRESDLLAFQIAMEIGRPGSVMCAYNRVNGEFACENDFLLNQVLRRDWGFKGFVMSDWGAVHSTRAITKGLDQQSGEQIDGKPYFSKLLRDELAAGTVPMSAVDTAASRILRTMYAYGLVDHPIVSAATIDYAANAAVAQQTAEAGIVLLKNEGGLLPIATSVKRIAVIGGHADIGVLSGGGSSQVRPVGGPALEVRPANKLAAAFASITYTPSSPLVALREALPHATIDY